MNKVEYGKIVECLKGEMIKALGCTEPIAIAYASARAREALGGIPDYAKILCSNNLIKNAKSVLIPSTPGMRGIESACAIGIAGGNCAKELEVLTDVTNDDIALAKKLIDDGVFHVESFASTDNLHMIVELSNKEHTSRVELKETHLGIVEVQRDGKVIYQKEGGASGASVNYECLTTDSIFEFVESVEIDDIAPLVDEQMRCNMAIAEEGLYGDYGVSTGKSLLECCTDDVATRACAYASAGSDARMSGCDLPVVINSGSGNQGITLTLPVMIYSEHLKCGREKTIRALVLSNLMAIYLKHGMGRLSAFCGAISAAAGAGAAITFMYGGNRQQIEDTITNTLATVSGIICDGANSSCAAKISVAVNCAILGGEMARKGRVIKGGEGIVKNSFSDTVDGVIAIGRDGMRQTDEVILKVMLK